MKKIPKWWYAGFEKNLFYGCYVFIKTWFYCYANPIWTIRDKMRKFIYYKWRTK